MDPWQRKYKRERAKRIAAIKASMTPPLVKGGQGRTGESVAQDGMAVLFTVAAAVLLVVLIVAERWARGTP